MLRLTTLVLILANAGFFAWQAGWLGEGLGGAASANHSTGAPRSPDRLQQQVNPGQLMVIKHQGQPSADQAPTNPVDDDQTRAAEAASSESAAESAKQTTSSEPQPGGDANGQCLEAGPFTQDEQRQANAMLSRILKADQWGMQSVAVPGLWLVYMGPYPDDESLERKESELRRIRNLPFEEVRSPATLARGLSLGKFTDERQANAALETLRQRGIRTARVVNARPAMELQVLRAPSIDMAQKAQLQKLPLPAGKGFIDCNG